MAQLWIWCQINNRRAQRLLNNLGRDTTKMMGVSSETKMARTGQPRFVDRARRNGTVWSGSEDFFTSCAWNVTGMEVG